MEQEKKKGVRPSDAVYEMALATLEDMLLQRIAWPRIVARLIEGGYTTSEHTIKDWRKEIRRRWAVQDAEEKPHRRDEHRELLKTLYHQSFATGDYRCAEKVARQLMILDGLNVPQQINLSGAVDVNAMTPQQRDAEIDQLLKKRQEAKERAARTNGTNGVN